MADYIPPGSTDYIKGRAISVSYGTLFGPSLSEKDALLTLESPLHNRLEPTVTGWSEPNHNLTSQAGTERLEDGSTITDHVVSMPARLTMRGHVSDVTHPLGANGPVLAFQMLRTLQQNESLLKVVTEWEVYENMFIRSVEATQTTRGMEFTIDLQEIRRVGVGNYSPTARSGPARGRGDEVRLGEQTLIGHVAGNRFFQFEGPGRASTRLDGIVIIDTDGRETLVKESDAVFVDGVWQRKVSRYNDETYVNHDRDPDQNQYQFERRRYEQQ